MAIIIHTRGRFVRADRTHSYNRMTAIHSIEPLEARIAPAFAPVFDLSSLNGSNGFTINGVASQDFSGISVSDAGDVNDDGFADVIIGTYSADYTTDAGESYVVFGKANGFAANVNLSMLDGSNGFKISGAAAGDASGGAISAAGDVNGDGRADLIVGAYTADPNGDFSGASYVLFGRSSGFPANLNLATLDGSNGFKIAGAAAFDISGSSVSGAGDVNGDGFDDVIVGAPQVKASGTFAGASYVIFGKGSGFAPVLDLSALNGANGFKISAAEAGDSAGQSVSAAGDVNGDGYEDVIVGALHATTNGRLDAGASYVLFGKGDGFVADVNVTQLDGTNGFRLSGEGSYDLSGWSVDTAGDVNGDGFDDVLVGAAFADVNGPNSGAAYVVFGKQSGFSANLNLAALNGTNGFKLPGIRANDHTGLWVSTAQDVDNDGFDDLLVGAPGSDGAVPGSAYLVFGKAAGFQAEVNLADLAGGDGFRINGFVAGDLLGDSVSAAGDMNGDGWGDIIIGAPGVDRPGVREPGASYVIFGSSRPTLSISDASLDEGNSGARGLSFTVNLSQPENIPVSVHVTARNGSAEAGIDFAAFGPTTITFAPGVTSMPLAVEVTGDTIFEGDETFSIVLSDATSAVVQHPTGEGTIRNDDAPPVVSIAGAAAIEGDLGMERLAFSVSLSTPSGLPVSMNFASVDGTALAGSDYALAPGTLNFAPGETTKTIAVELLGDTSIEDHESFGVILSDASGATIGTDTASGTILNDDTALRIGDVSGGEGDSGTSPFVYAIALEKASAIPVTVSYQTADGTAIAGSDYEAVAPTQLTFAPGETMKSISIAVTGDTEVEAHETFSVVLAGAAGALIADDTGTAMILNDDTLLRINDAAALEGHTGTHGMTFTVSLSAPTALPVSVNFATADGAATAGSDYIALTPGTLNFAPGETSKTVTVDVMGDTVVEPSETFSIVLSQASNAVIDHATAVGTILDDDVTLRGKRSATYTDVDGDLVTIKVSEGTLKVEDFTLVPSGSGAQLALVDFSGQTELAGANLSVTAKRAVGTPGGDRVVDVGHVNATGLDLGKVMIAGDLGQIDAGNDLDPRPGLLSLSARSLGHRGLDTQLPSGSLRSEIVGALKTLKLADGMQDATLAVSDDIGRIDIKGSVLGSAIRSDGRIGAIKISGDLAGDPTNASMISSRGILLPASDAKALAIGTLSIGGSVDHAEILAGYDRTGAAVNTDTALGRVTVGGNWTASDLAAGVSSGADGMFGTDDDVLISGGNQIIAKIASVVIKGTVSGGTDHFGFVAEQIASFSAGGVRLALLAGPSNDLSGLPVGSADTVKVRELA